VTYESPDSLVKDQQPGPKLEKVIHLTVGENEVVIACMEPPLDRGKIVNERKIGPPMSIKKMARKRGMHRIEALGEAMLRIRSIRESRESAKGDHTLLSQVTQW